MVGDCWGIFKLIVFCFGSFFQNLPCCVLAFGKLTLKLSHIGKRERWELPYIRELLMEYYFIITCTFGGPLWCEAPYHARTRARATADRGPGQWAVWRNAALCRRTSHVRIVARSDWSTFLFATCRTGAGYRCTGS